MKIFRIYAVKRANYERFIKTNTSEQAKEFFLKNCNKPDDEFFTSLKIDIIPNHHESEILKYFDIEKDDKKELKHNHLIWAHPELTQDYLKAGYELIELGEINNLFKNKKLKNQKTLN